MKKKCPCCGFYTIDSDEETDICEVCFWQYDVVAQQYPDKIIGPNKVLLREARNNYCIYGACLKEFADKNLVRKPLTDELPTKYK